MADALETVVVVDMVAQSGVGERRELYVDARDINWEDGMTEAEFVALLYERGLTKLAEFNGRERVECEIDASKMGNMDFALGDNCTYRNPELSVVAEGRVTELEQVIENGELTTNIILGKERLHLLQRIKQG